MLRNRVLFAFASALAVGIVSVPCALARSPERAPERGPESMLPADTDIYFGWDGTEKHKSAWENSACYEALEKTRLLQTIVDFALSNKPENPRLPRAAVRQLLATIARKGVSLSIAFPDGGPLPRIVFVLHGGAALEPAITAALPRIGRKTLGFQTSTVRSRRVHRLTFTTYRYTGNAVVESPGPDLSWWAEGGHLVLAFGKGSVEAALDAADGKSPGILQSANWRKYREEPHDFQTILAAWFDVRALRSRLNNYVLQEQNDINRRFTLGQLIDALGGERTGCFSVRCGLKDRALVSEIRIESPAPRTGLMALADQAPITLADLPPLPEGSANFFATSFNWSKAYDAIVGMIRGIAVATTVNGAAEFDKFLRQAPEVLGFDPKADVCDALGHVVCLHLEPAAGIPGGIGVGLAISVEKPDRLRKALKAGLQRLQDATNNAVTVIEEDSSGRATWLFKFANVPIQPATALDKKWLFVGLTRQSVQASLMRVDGKLARWKPNAAEQEALKSVPQEAISLSLSDPGLLYGKAVTYFPILASLGGRAENPEARRAFARRMAILGDFPPVEVLIRPMFPHVTAGTVDKDGVRFRSRDSVPGIPLIASLVGPAAWLIGLSEK